MLAAYAAKFDADDPIAALEVGERPEPTVPAGWVTIDVRATALNHHDLWSLKGVGLAEQNLPMILGCDAAGVDPDGNEVVVHAVVSDPSWKGDETLDPKRSLLSERYQGTLAQKVAVPARNVVPKPAGMSFEQAPWSHSLKSLKQGGTLVLSGATSGQAPKSAELNRIFFLQLRVQGSTMGTRTELAQLVQFMANAGIEPHIDTVLPLADARTG